MEINELLESIGGQRIKIGLTLVLVISYFIFNKISADLIHKYGLQHGISLSRVVYTTKYFRFVTFILCLLILGITWDISFEGLSFYFLSFFTVAGIGLFATWSILSNITSAIILFFYFPIRIGQKVRIMDGENSIEGMIFNLTLFSIIIENDKGQKISYPNNLVLQKGIIHMEVK